VDLILWRHADAEDGGPGHPDNERKLTPKGRAGAREVAAWLSLRLPDRFIVLSSPAVRARETAMFLRPEPVIEPSLSTGTSPGAFLSATGWPDRKGTVVAVGHQPTLGEVAALILTGERFPWTIKKGAVWWFRIHPEKGEGPVLRAVVSPETVSSLP
jgi:phosphohistidine phosphatase